MPIKIERLNTPKKNNNNDDGDEIVGQITHGHGVVPDYTGFEGIAVRSEDPDVVKAIKAEYPEGRLESHPDDKKPYYVVFPEGFELPLVAHHLKTGLVLRNASFKPARKCDGVTQEDGSDCACAKLYELGSDEWREGYREGLACKPEGMIVATIPGVPGKFMYSKASESTVRPIEELEAAADGMPRPVAVKIGLKPVTSKKTGYSWTVPEFTAPAPAEADAVKVTEEEVEPF
jgi:hypothetical protein